MEAEKELVLSICIATYNQPEKFRRLMDSIRPQLIPEVELLIADDSSNDETHNTFVQHGISCRHRYVRGEKKGLDSALLFLTREATGKFVWWVGDDVILPGGINEIVRTIKKNPDLTFLWLNSCDVKNHKTIAFADTGEYPIEDGNKLLEKNLGQLGFITATLFRRSTAAPCLAEAEKYIGSAWVCLYIILYVISCPGKFYYFGTPMIASDSKPPGEKRWYDQFQVFCINIFKITKVFKNKFSRKSLGIALRKNLRQCIKAVLVERAAGFSTGFGSFSPKALPMLMNYWRYWEAWIALPLFMIPRKILSALYFIYRKLKDIFSRNNSS